MNRFKRHKVKREKTEASASYTREADEHDLAYYIHDRVELMHQVFSVLKHKELRSIAPECVRHISIDDLQELCTEELLGISSKRLCAVLDGAEPPSDTESSSQSEPEQLETISLDSISSDEEILSQGSKKKKHKHRRRDSKSKSKKKRTKSKEPEAAEDAEKSKASRAGLTVLELLELQARARAIRAQLQQEQARKQAEPAPAEDKSSASENEVEIKEEPPEVVEISSDDEKPKIEELEKALPKANNDPKENGVEVEATNKSSEKNKETSKSKEKRNKKDKSKKDKKKEKEKKSKDLEKDSEKVSEKHNIDVERDQNDLRNKIDNAKNKSPELSKEVDNTQKVTKKINDLIITVPQQHSRKIKLKRNKVTVSVSNTESVASAESSNRTVSITSSENTTDEIRKPTGTMVKSTVQVINKPKQKIKDKSKKKHKRKEKNKSSDKETSDHDEITLQLSDSEKMDLLEDFDRRNLDKVTSSSDDSDSSSDSESESSQDSSKDIAVGTRQSIPVENDDNKRGNHNENNQDLDKNEENKAVESENESNAENTQESTSKDLSSLAEASNTCADDDENGKNEKTLKEQNEKQVITTDAEKVNNENTIITDKSDAQNNIQGFISSNGTENNLVVNNIDDIPIREDILEPQNTETDKDTTKTNNVNDISITEENPPKSVYSEKDKVLELSQKYTENDTENTQHESTECPNEINDDTETINATPDSNTNLSEGEVSSNESSEVEACELKPEVVCISDEEADNNESPKKKKHKKKEKKSKKAKKAKKSKSDFREGADQNFYSNTDIQVIDNDEDEKMSSDSKEYVSLLDDDEIYEILESSDELSCSEVECTILSKEPTTEEIEALSAKIDEIERVDVVTEEQIREHERKLIANLNTNENNTENEYNSEDTVENLTWKDRYLESKKVKTVLTTSHILNTLRKKNKELKKKLEESRKEEQKITIEEPTVISVENKDLEEGSIEHYNTLQGSTKYVNPVPDPVTENGSTETPENTTDKINTEIQVTGEMKKDAKLLLKIYKKLLKYNNIKKPKDPNKKKKKKQKKKDKSANTVASNDVVNQ